MFVIGMGAVNFQVALPLVSIHFLSSFPGETGFLCEKSLAFRDRATFCDLFCSKYKDRKLIFHIFFLGLLKLCGVQSFHRCILSHFCNL